jgi:hypothetical protein
VSIFPVPNLHPHLSFLPNRPGLSLDRLPAGYSRIGSSVQYLTNAALNRSVSQQGARAKNVFRESRLCGVRGWGLPRKAENGGYRHPGSVGQPLVQVAASSSNLRWLHVPATTFVITHSPSRSNDRDALDAAAGRRSRSGCGPSVAGVIAAYYLCEKSGVDVRIVSGAPFAQTLLVALNGLVECAASSSLSRRHVAVAPT